MSVVCDCAGAQPTSECAVVLVVRIEMRGKFGKGLKRERVLWPHEDRDELRTATGASWDVDLLCWAKPRRIPEAIYFRAILDKGVAEGRSEHENCDVRGDTLKKEAKECIENSALFVKVGQV